MQLWRTVTRSPLKPAASSSAALIDPHWSSLTSCSTFQPMHARPSATGKKPETEENFCRPGGVTSPHFSWPPARHTGRSQEVEWTPSDEEERLRAPGLTDKWTHSTTAPRSQRKSSNTEKHDDCGNESSPFDFFTKINDFLLTVRETVYGYSY